MSAQSRDQFIACLKKSKAMDDAAVDSWMSRVDDQDPRKIATKLVRDKMLTSWQAKFLLSGRSRLTVGNYRLLSRINRDELGDRFEAIHSQLGRKVVIQIFPSAISKDTELQSRVLKAMQQMTELDHPSLVHVYDVDQEGDRYFVVTEFVDGTALSELPRGDLNDTDVATIIADLITGVKYAHQEGVIHGNILQENVLVIEQSRAKLQGLPTSAVRCEMADSSGNLSDQQDFVAISKLGCSVLQEVPPKRRGDGYDTLVKVVGALASADNNSLEKVQLKLAQWIAKHRPAPAGQTESAPGALPSKTSASGTGDLALAQPVDPQAAPEGGFDAPVAALPPTKLAKKKKKKAEPEPVDEQAGFLATMWNEKRALSVAAIAATLLTLVGGIGATGFLMAGSSATGSNNGDAVAKKDRNKNKPASQTSAVEKASSAKANKRKKEFKIGELAAGEGLLSGDRSADALDPEATKRKFEEMYAKQNNNKKGKKGKGKGNPNRKKTEPVTALKPAAVANIDGGPKVQGDATAKPQPAKPQPAMAASKKPAVAKPEETKTAAVVKPVPKPDKPAPKKKVSPPKGNPFAKLPETFELPLSTDMGDVKIADLTIDKRYLMGLELLAGPEVCKHKFLFDLKRSATDKQLWDIRLQRRKRDDPLPVAQIQKTPTELKFRWLPAAEKFDDANYIRNCKIKLSAAKDFGWIGLRKPIDIQDFAFESGKTSIKSDIDLKWLPNPQGLKIELSPFQIEERNGDNERGKVFFTPREVLKKAPGLIFFRDKEELKFFFLEIGVEIRSKLKMTGQMYVLGANGAPQPLRKPADILNLADVLAGRKAEAERFQAIITQAKNKAGVVKIFPNLKDEGDFAAISKKASKATDLATRQAVTCNDYSQIIENLSDLRIPFEIYFEMDGHRIRLAESTAQPMPGKKK